MADRPADEWEVGEDGYRRLTKRAKHTDHSGDPREEDAVTGFDRKPLAGGEKYAPNVPNGHRLTADPDKKKSKSKAVSGADAENKAVSSSSTK